MMLFEGLINRFSQEAIEWSRGKNWAWRVFFLGWFGYVLIRYMSDPSYTCLLSPLNLGVHELGHLVFSFLGHFFGILGGTLLQVMIPLFSVLNFYRQRDFYAIALSFGWLSSSLFDAARYIADARAMELPLVTPFGADNAIHDWNFLLSRLGLLQFDKALAFMVKISAVLSMGVCLFAGGWLLWQMKQSEKS